jgi:hypothetical protein
VLKAVEKGRACFELAPKIEPELWYRNTKLSSVDTRTVNRIITTHTYTPNWLANMKVCDLCEEEMGICTTHFIHLHEIHQAKANMRLPRQTNTTESNIRKRRHSSMRRNNKISEGHHWHIFLDLESSLKAFGFTVHSYEHHIYK